MVVSYRIFGTTFRFHFQANGYPETSVKIIILPCVKFRKTSSCIWESGVPPRCRHSCRAEVCVTRPYTSYDMQDLNIRSSKLKSCLHFLYHVRAPWPIHLSFLDLVVIIRLLGLIKFLITQFSLSCCCDITYHWSPNMSLRTSKHAR